MSAGAPVPSSVKPEQFDTNPSKVTKMFLNCFSHFGWILNLPPLPPHQKPQNLNVWVQKASEVLQFMLVFKHWHNDAKLNCAEPGRESDDLLLRVSRQQQELGFVEHCKLPFCLLRRHFSCIIKEPKIQFSQ